MRESETAKAGADLTAVLHFAEFPVYGRVCEPRVAGRERLPGSHRCHHRADGCTRRLGVTPIVQQRGVGRPFHDAMSAVG